MAKQKWSPRALEPYRFIGSVTMLSLLGIGLLAIRIIDSDSLRYSFLIWNLVLAAVPVFLAWWLATRIRQYGWMKWQQILLTLLWIIFLPNSFYIITDLLHLRANFEADLLFDIVILVSFIVSGLVLGFISVYFVHREMEKRMRDRKAYAFIALLFLAVSFAICLGRYTRWNTWDIILRPAGLLFDVSDRLINPTIHIQTYQTTIMLFLLLFTSYVVVWEGIRLIRSNNQP